MCRGLDTHPIHVLKGEPTSRRLELLVFMHRVINRQVPISRAIQVLSQGMVVAGNIKETAESVNSPSYKGDQMSKVLTLSIGLVLSILLLIFGAKLATTAIAIVLFVVSFFLTFGFLDSMLYKPGVPPNFNMCVMPWVAAVIIAMLCAILVLCCAAKLAELSLFVLGFALGAVGMYLARSAIVASVPELMKETHGFSYYGSGYRRSAMRPPRDLDQEGHIHGGHHHHRRLRCCHLRRWLGNDRHERQAHGV